MWHMRHADFVSLVEKRLAARGQSAIVAAREAGLNRDAIRSVLRGRSPSIERVAEICDALGLEMHFAERNAPLDPGIAEPLPKSRVQVAPANAAELRRVLESATKMGVELAERARDVARHLGLDELVAAAPIVGRIVAGVPTEADQHEDGWVPFPAAWAAGGSCFALQVAGDSMMLAGILDGDTAIVRRQETARSGEIVAATVEGETTLKRYATEGDARLLVAENTGYKPIDMSTKGVVVHGRVVGLLRAYR